eukprot:Em0022g478a
MHLIEELGPPFGIFINLAKCELFSRNELSSTFPVMIKSSQVPHFEILGAPIGDFLFCSKFIASRHKIASKLLSKLEEVASIDPQRILSQRLDDHSFGLVIAAATDADKARLLSTSAPHAASWLSVVPSVGLGLHLDPNELQIAVMWWLHDVFLSFCHQAHIAARLEAGSGLTPGLDRTRPADVLVRDWAQGKPAAFDITVTSPLTPAILAEASRRVGAAAEAAENREHTANDPKCAELGWRVISDMFGRLNITLVRAIARAILARNVIPTDFN